ncbi:dephospho-CoA kinase [Mangrovihabitans endophyticus]|uniref:Dephospho-CoA kinase n=1 Tax=Mangrovihabitans endophyticus TaxID=1751298 RepID=A0A8J3BUX9_9ACTN|nr:dephospho-CoA kinase [Mangrovihabitans endophyticus]GGK71243.1 dephospho-CoA kinase [Mangrovihabitans endophyticus]
MLSVGLTGGIGAGKSTVSARLALRGAIVIDADVLAREAVAPGTAGLAEVVARFGRDVLRADGALDRPALGSLVFSEETARRDLESIIHPRVQARRDELTGRAGPDAIVVHDVPLLVETGLAPHHHLVVVVHADQQTRVRRLVHTRDITAEQATARIAAQAGDAERRAAADVLMDNAGSRADLEEAVDRLWDERLRPFERNLRHARVPPRGAWLRLVPYDPRWPQEACRLAGRIRQATGAPVHHIGSTAVPGLLAKNVIDLMLGVRTLADADALADRLTRAGFPPRAGEWFDNARGMPGETWPKRLHGSADPARPVNLHLRVIGSPGWRFALLMRDHLRAVPQARADYATSKQTWREEHPEVDAYAQAKEPWFDAEARAADDWAEAVGWQPA